MITVPGADEEPQEEFEADHPNLALLQELTQPTGGAVDAPVRSLVGRKPGTRRIDHPFDWVLIPAAMLLFLADVAVRRLEARRGRGVNQLRRDFDARLSHSSFVSESAQSVQSA